MRPEGECQLLGAVSSQDPRTIEKRPLRQRFARKTNIFLSSCFVLGSRGHEPNGSCCFGPFNWPDVPLERKSNVAQEQDRTAWAEKMAGVLDAPVGLGSGGATPAGGGGSGTAGASANGRAPAADSPAPTAPTPAGRATPGQPAAGAPGGATPKAATPEAPSAAPTGSSAKESAAAAKAALEDVKATAAEAKRSADEGKKFLSEAEQGRKLAEDARQQAKAAEMAIKPAAAVPAPQGQDPAARYDSAIQISGQVKVSLANVLGQTSAVDEQAANAAVGKATVDVAAEGAKANAEKMATLSKRAATQAEAGSHASNSAATAAAESKNKAAQSAKDNAADKDALAKAAADDATHAKSAKDACAKAQAEAKRAANAAASAAVECEKIAKISQQARDIVDETQSMSAATTEKTKPYHEAVGKADVQELECRQELSEFDADEVLRKRYEALGGDPELTRLMAAEDKQFETLVETQRAELKKWQAQRKGEIDDHKAELEDVIESADSFTPAYKKWLKEADPPAGLATSVKQLGKKLKTESGIELLHEISHRKARIERAKTVLAFNEKVVARAKASLEAVNQQHEKVDKEYEASEAFIKQMRTELDNLLQIDAMSLEEKVHYLQSMPQPVSDNLQKKLDRDLQRILKLTILQASANASEYDEPYEPFEPDPIDWSSVEAKITALSKAKLEDLQADDEKLVDVRKDYEAAGGDAALLNKRITAWRSRDEMAKRTAKSRVDDYQSRSAKLRQQFTAADARYRHAVGKRDAYQHTLKYVRSKYDTLHEKVDPMVPFGNFTDQERSEYQVLQREIKRYESSISATEAECQSAQASRDGAEKLIELERQRHEQAIDDDRPTRAKPTSEGIHRMPLSAKYTELTGKAMPVDSA